MGAVESCKNISSLIEGIYVFLLNIPFKAATVSEGIFVVNNIKKACEECIAYSYSYITTYLLLKGYP